MHSGKVNNYSGERKHCAQLHYANLLQSFEQIVALKIYKVKDVVR